MPIRFILGNHDLTQWTKTLSLEIKSEGHYLVPVISTSTVQSSAIQPHIMHNTTT